MASQRRNATPSSLLDAHNLTQDLIAAALPQTDRLRLAATCRTLRAASLRWFPDAQAELHAGDTTAAESLAAWLRHYRVRAHLKLVIPQALATSNTAAAASATLHPLATCPAVAGCIASLSGAAPSPGMHLPTPCLAPFCSLERLDFLHGLFGLQGSLEPLWHLQGLRRLSLAGGGLIGEWAGISRLSRLESLDLCEHNMRAVAGALPALGCLTELDISDDGEEQVDWSPLTALQRLQVLSLQLERKGNVAAQLPALARTLRRLALDAGNLAAIPPELAVCTGLTRLEVSCNPDNAWVAAQQAGFSIASLSHLATLTHLHHLSMSILDRDSSDLPEVLSTLTALTHLSLGDVFQEGWEHLRPLKHLQELLLDNVHLLAESAAELAGALSALPVLRTLSLDSMDFFEGGWGDVWPALVRVTRLQALNLGWCDAAPLPPQITDMRELSSLSLRYCPEDDTPQAAASLEHLRPLAGTLADLDLSSWHMTELPPVLTALTSLTHLDLSGNRIAGGWEQLQALPLLVRLDMQSQQV
ncbi:hypothetical protein ABPG75_007878 [Micractinium tetrahymenae]